MFVVDMHKMGVWNMVSKIKYIFIMLLWAYQSAANANTTNDQEEQKLANEIQSKIIEILNLHSSLGDMQLNATYKNIKTLNMANKSNNNNLIEAFQPLSATCNHNQQIELNSLAIREVQTQLTKLEAAVHNLSQQHSREQGQATSCLVYADDNTESIQLINVPGISQFRVLCGSCEAGAGWIVIQQRFDGSIDFYRDWQAYRNGFGYYKGEFFIGLEYIHHLTNSQQYELYVELVDFDNWLYYARYNSFLIGSEQEHYQLKSLGSYSGNAGDALKYNLLDRFSTYDNDRDGWKNGNCANYYESGWWFGWDVNSNLNGQYFKGSQENAKGIWWYTLNGYYSMKSVKMLIRPKYTL